MAKILRRLFIVSSAVILMLLSFGFNGITAYADLPTEAACTTHPGKFHWKLTGVKEKSPYGNWYFWPGTQYDSGGNISLNTTYYNYNFESGKTPDEYPDAWWYYGYFSDPNPILLPCDGHHTHTYETAWSSDATNHWKASTCGHTSEMSSLAAHTWNSSTGKCSVCGYECLHTGEGGLTCSKCGKVLHAHTWEYSAVGTDTIKATCNVDNHTTANDVTITISASDTAYTGGAVGASLSNTSAWSSNVTSVPAIKYVGREGTSYSESTSAPTAVGKYTAKIIVDTTEASVDYEITKANPTLSPAPSAKTLTYDGSAQDLVNAGTVSNGTTYYRLGTDGAWGTAVPTATDAGNYSVYYYVKGNTNYNDLGSETVPHGSVAVTINGKAITATVDGVTTAYDGGSYSISITVSDPASGAVIEYSTEENGTYSTTNPGFIDVGTHTVYYRIEFVNYATKTGSADVIINGLDFDASDIDVQDYSGTYDGFSYGITVTAPEGATVTYSTVSAGTYSVTNPEFTDAGTYTVYYKVNKTGYNEDSGYSTVTINPKAITATVSAANKTYDGTNAATVTASVNAADLISGDSVVVTGLTGTFTSVNVNTGITVNVDESGKAINGTGSGNYSVTIPATTTANITQAAPSITSAPTGIPNVVSVRAGSSQPLFAAGSTSEGTLKYKVGTNGTWSTTVPTAAALQAGTYDVYYMIEGDSNHSDRQEATWKITVKVEPGSVTIHNEDTIVKGGTNVNATGATSSNLDKIPASNVVAGKDIEVKLEATAKAGSSDATAMEATVTQAMGVANGSIIKEYVDVTITKTVAGESPETIADTQTAVEVVFSYDVAPNKAYMIVRSHNGVQTAFKQLASKPSSYTDGTFFVDKTNKKIYMYSRYFSEYMIASVAGGYTVSFDSNGGSAVEAITVLNNVAVLPIPYRSGYSFAGWYEEATFATPFTTSTVLAGDITVYAKWTKNSDGEFDLSSFAEAAPKTTTVNVTHTVVKGDTMSRIARKYGLTLAQLVALNPQVKNINRIYSGQIINVGTETKTVTESEIKQAEIKTPSRSVTTYVVKKGDTLLKIARNNRMSLAEIAALNGNIKDLHWIYSGQVININK